MKNETGHILGDPLSDVTRSERRNLLLSCLLAYAVITTRSVPQKVELLGIDFAQTDQQAFLWVLAVIVGYFLVAFLVYSVADLLSWLHSLLSMRMDNIKELLSENRESTLLTIDTTQAISEHIDRKFKKVRERTMVQRYYLGRFARPLGILRAMFEFILPVILSIFVLYSIVNYSSEMKIGTEQPPSPYAKPGAAE